MSTKKVSAKNSQSAHWTVWLKDCFGPEIAVHKAWLAEISELVPNHMGRSFAVTASQLALAEGYTPADDIYDI